MKEADIFVSASLYLQTLNRFLEINYYSFYYTIIHFQFRPVALLVLRYNLNIQRPFITGILSHIFIYEIVPYNISFFIILKMTLGIISAITASSKHDQNIRWHNQQDCLSHRIRLFYRQDIQQISHVHALP